MRDHIDVDFDYRDCESRDQLSQLLRAMPLYRYFKLLLVTPLVDHPLFPGGRTGAVEPK